MTTFDQVLPTLSAILKERWPALNSYLPILVNRDLNGRIRLILDAKHQPDSEDTAEHPLHQLAEAIHGNLFPHVGSLEQLMLFEDDLSADLNELSQAGQSFQLMDIDGQALNDVHVVDRLAQEATWESILEPPESSESPDSRFRRVVFYSIKGGVGRSTALASCAWSLAAAGLRVLVLDLDLESPGLSTSLLPQDRQPRFGITDWLVEDLVGNGDAVLPDIHASLSAHQRGGEVIVVPSHGNDPGEYVSKLGRVWMPGFGQDHQRQGWSVRLRGLIEQLEHKHQPSIVLIDSRAGIDEVASACVTDLGAQQIYLFAVDSRQTWQGYRILFDHWRLHGVAPKIRERLQVVGAMMPTWGDQAFQRATSQLREQAYLAFSEGLYDEAVADADPYDAATTDPFNFDLLSDDAPHNPCAIRWDQGFAAIQSLHERLSDTEADQIKLVFGPLLMNLQDIAERKT
jgi:hypothetical protein